MREEFAREIQKAITESQRINCSSDIFIGMIETRHPVEVAKSLVLSGTAQSGFKKAIQIGRKDITIEYIMLMPKFNTLFTSEELNAARFRLDNWDKLS
jgi:hypothetical protein